MISLHLKLVCVYESLILTAVIQHIILPKQKYQKNKAVPQNWQYQLPIPYNILTHFSFVRLNDILFNTITRFTYVRIDRFLLLL